VAVADPAGEAALRAVAQAASLGLADAILVGEATTIRERLDALGLGAETFRIEDVPAERAAAAAVALVRTGEAQILMKGMLSSSSLMQAVLDREQGLRTGRLLSDVFLFDFGSGEQRRLVGITDGGVNPAPDLEKKAGILQNAVDVFHRLGVVEPRVAILSAIETPKPEFPASQDAVALVRRWQDGQFPDCTVDGPLAMDLALSEGAARMKGVTSPVAGRADVLLFPGLEAANITAKAVEYTVPLEPAHVVVGASAPVLIPSRSESTEARLNAIALGGLMVDGVSDAPDSPVP